jgi:20S proteasome alpha/beta subunit
MATDSRATYDDAPLMREEAGKIVPVGNRFCMATIGWTGGADRVLDEVKLQFEKARIQSTRAFIDLCEDVSFNYLKRYKERLDILNEDGDDWSFFLACASSEGIFTVEDGTSEQAYDYRCFGSSDNYGEYILKQLYKPNSSLREGTNWAAYAIKQAMSLDPNVGGPVYIAHITESGVRILTREEVLKVEQQISSQSPEFQRDLFELVDKIVQARRDVNQFTMKSHKLPLFNQQEASIWTLVHPVVTEQDFTDRILALCVLVDEMSFQDNTSQANPPGVGSIGGLEKWLQGQHISKEKVEKMTKVLRQVRSLRNKKLPVHPDDSEFISVVLGWGLSFPPDWARLHLMAVNKYLSFLEDIRTVFTERPET